jgi:glyoxylate reductase
MTEMKVLVTLNIPEVGIDLLKQEGLQVEVWRDERPLTTQELLEKSRDCQALLATGSNLIDRKFLDQSRHLKIISQCVICTSQLLQAAGVTSSQEHIWDLN